MCGNALEIAERDNVLYRRFCIGQSGPYLCSHLGFFGIFGNVAGNFPLAQTANELVFVAVSVPSTTGWGSGRRRRCWVNTKNSPTLYSSLKLTFFNALMYCGMVIAG